MSLWTQGYLFWTRAPGLEQKKYKMNLEHLTVAESKEVIFKKKEDKGLLKGTGANLKELPVARAETVWATT